MNSDTRTGLVWLAADRRCRPIRAGASGYVAIAIALWVALNLCATATLDGFMTPSVVVFHTSSRRGPAAMTDLSQIAEFHRLIERRPMDAMPADLASRKYIAVSVYWGPAWMSVANDREKARALRAEQANQHAWLYLPVSGKSGYFLETEPLLVGDGSSPQAVPSVISDFSRLSVVPPRALEVLRANDVSDEPLVLRRLADHGHTLGSAGQSSCAGHLNEGAAVWAAERHQARAGSGYLPQLATAVGRPRHHREAPKAGAVAGHRRAVLERDPLTLDSPSEGGIAPAADSPADVRRTRPRRPGSG
jgi:hypothetical protein